MHSLKYTFPDFQGGGQNLAHCGTKKTVLKVVESNLQDPVAESRIATEVIWGS